MVHVGPARCSLAVLRRSAKGKPEVNLSRNPRTPIFREIEIAFVLLENLVDEKGFEPSASSLRTRRLPAELLAHE